MELKQKIMDLSRKYDNKYAKTTLRKVIRLLKVILVDEETELIRISKLVPIGIETIKKYAEYNEFIEILLTKEEYDILRKKVNHIIEAYNSSIKDDSVEVLQNIIDDIFNTRYRLDDICIKNFLSPGRFSKILLDENYLDRCFGVGTKQKIKDRLKETSLIRTKVPRDEYVIEDGFQLLIVKPEITHLNNLDFRKLSLAASYIDSGADIDYITKQHETNFLAIVPLLSSTKVKEILKEEYYAILQRCMVIENLLLGNDIIQKRDFLVNLVEFLVNNNFDKQQAANYYGIPENLINRLLKETIKLTILNDELKNQIISSFSTRNETDVKKK